MYPEVTFDRALLALKTGGGAWCRSGWSGKTLAVHLNPGNPPMRPFFVLTDISTGTEQTWVPSIGDLLADDWHPYTHGE